MQSSYLQNLLAHRMLTREEEQALAERIVNGDKAAVHELTLHNFRLVVAIAKKNVSERFTLDDAVEHGIFGLLEAANRFKPLGFKFSTYATPYIQRFIWDAKAEGFGPIYVPPYVGTLIAEAQIGIPHKYYTKNADRLISRGLAAHGAMSFNDVDNIKELSELFVEPDDDTVHISRRELYDSVLVAMEKLPERMQLLLRLRHGMEDGTHYTLEQIGGRLGVTRERVRQIEERACELIREYVPTALANAFFGTETELPEVEESEAA